MAELTRRELGLGLLLGYLVTPRGKVIGEIKLPKDFEPVFPKVEIASLKIGIPALEIKTKETSETTYQEICKIEVPEGVKLSLEEISFMPITAPDNARFKVEIGDLAIEDIALPSNVAWTGAFRGRIELETGKRVWIGIKTTSGAVTVKGQASINGVIV